MVCLHVPDNPIIPFIEGDGIGVDITPAMIEVVDNAVEDCLRWQRKRLSGWKFIAEKKSTNCLCIKILGFLMKL